MTSFAAFIDQSEHRGNHSTLFDSSQGSFMSWNDTRNIYPAEILSTATEIKSHLKNVKCWIITVTCKAEDV